MIVEQSESRSLGRADQLNTRLLAMYHSDNYEAREGGPHAAQTLETTFVLMDHESRSRDRHVINFGGGQQCARDPPAVTTLISSSIARK